MKAYQNKRFATLGAPYPDVVFEDKDGNSRRLSEFKGKYLFIDLWASWSKPYQEEVAYLKKIKKELKNNQIAFVSISIDSDRNAWLKKIKALDLNGNQWVMTDKNFLRMLNIKDIPQFLLYSKEGTLMQYRTPNPSSEEELKKVLSRLK